MSGTQYPLTLVVKALDKATGPLRAMTTRLKAATAPFRAFAKDFGEFSRAANFAGIGKGMAGVGREAFALGAKLFALAGVAGFALFSVVKGAVNAGDELGMMADRVGMGVDAFASLRHAANLADVDQEQFNSSLDQFNKRMGQLKANSGPMLAFLEKVSPTLAKQVKGAKSTEGAFAIVTDAMAKLTDTGKQAAFADALFGKGGKGMAAFMKQGGAAIQKQQLAYLALVGSQEEFARGAGELDNAMKDTEQAFMGLRSAAMGALFPAFTKLSKALTGFLVANREGIAKWAKGAAEAITTWVNGGGIERLIEGMREFGRAISWVLEKIGGFKGALVAVGLFMAGPLIASVFSLAAAMAPLGVALAPFIVASAPFLLAAAAIALVGYQIHQNWAPLSALYSSLAEAATGLLNVFAGIATWDFARVVQGWTTAINGFKDALVPALMLLQQVAGGGMLTNFLVGSGIVGNVGAKPIGAADARVNPASVSSGGSSRVEVNFSNVPRGVQVSADKNSSQPIDLSVGRSMMSGG